HNYLAALCRARGAYALAWADISTGDFQLAEVTLDSLDGELARIRPGELLLSDHLLQDAAVSSALADWRERITLRAPRCFDADLGLERLKALHGLAAVDRVGADNRAALGVIGAIVDYLTETQKS